MPWASHSRITRAVASLVVVLAFGAGCSATKAPEPAPPPVAAPAIPEFPQLVLRLGERKVYLVEAKGHKGEAFPVAIGRHPWPTPVGKWAVNEMVENPDFIVFDWNNPEKMHRRIPPGPKNPLGLRWIGFTSAYGWDIGFHGTPKPESIGQAVSHGCVRMHNKDVVKIFSKVRLGTPVIVEP